MNEMKVRGIILKEVKVGEGNKIFTVLTDSCGKISVSGAGVRSYKSRLAAGCGLFCCSEFILKKGRSLYNIVSAEKLADFYGLRYSVEKLAHANYFCELAGLITDEGTESAPLLQLLLNTLHYLTGHDCYVKIKAVYELRLLCAAGFAPHLSSCAACGAADGLTYFSAAHGGVLCSRCAGKSNMGADAKKAAEYIAAADVKKIFAFRLGEAALSELAALSEDYAVHHIGRYPKALSYLKAL